MKERNIMINHNNEDLLRERLHQKLRNLEDKIKEAESLENLDLLRREINKRFRKSASVRGYLKRKITLKGIDLIHGEENIFNAMEYSEHHLTLNDVERILENAEQNQDVNAILKLADYYHYRFEQTGESEFENVWLEVYTSVVVFPKVNKQKINETTRNIKRILAGK